MQNETTAQDNSTRAAPSPHPSDPEARNSDLDRARLDLERTRTRTDIMKWITAAIGAVASLWMIDYGKLKLERFRVTAENQRQLLEAYLKATESPHPDMWKRKLHVLEHFAADKQMRSWAQAELQYIEEFAGLDVLYRETLKVAAQLSDPNLLKDPERAMARARYNQLYWAELPFAGESEEVKAAMIKFRKKLLLAEQSPEDALSWKSLSTKLYLLSEALRQSTPKSPR
ncbi:hypothetical protein JY651_22725 [Pyxidicoccus parkwayensis]|uniref:Uncharacterized protein n=1 Tax=Pyxidicoccus parkwayensis TaxID=2813578 RepID=A0ABX7PAW5_9BACT|nr:hypothetical protein [Pyxidicoccus parkwaysis]QSQ27553.1 hypothetical protein JY651_22725 [Pyxidicoccus parkwaysis]